MSADHSGSPADFVDVFKTYYGPTMNAFAAASANGKESKLEAELIGLFTSENRSDDPERTVIPATYLRVSVQV